MLARMILLHSNQARRCRDVPLTSVLPASTMTSNMNRKLCKLVYQWRRRERIKSVTFVIISLRWYWTHLQSHIMFKARAEVTSTIVALRCHSWTQQSQDRRNSINSSSHCIFITNSVDMRFTDGQTPSFSPRAPSASTPATLAVFRHRWLTPRRLYPLFTRSAHQSCHAVASRRLRQAPDRNPSSPCETRQTISTSCPISRWQGWRLDSSNTCQQKCVMM